MMWAPVLIAALGTYLEKIAGYLLPERVLNNRVVHHTAGLLPVALLSAIVAVQAFTTGKVWVFDARVPGMLVAFVLILRKTNFLVMVVAATATTAAVRALGLLP